MAIEKQTQSLRQKWLGAPMNPIGLFAFNMIGETALNGGISANGVASAATKAALWTGAEMLMGPFAWAVNLAPVLAYGGAAAFTAYNRAKMDSGRTTRAPVQFDQKAAYTMRQRAVQAIQESRLNARSALGNEASLLHR